MLFCQRPAFMIAPDPVDFQIFSRNPFAVKSEPPDQRTRCRIAGLNEPRPETRARILSKVSAEHDASLIRAVNAVNMHRFAVDGIRIRPLEGFAQFRRDANRSEIR